MGRDVETKRTASPWAKMSVPLRTEQCCNGFSQATVGLASVEVLHLRLASSWSSGFVLSPGLRPLLMLGESYRPGLSESRGGCTVVEVHGRL